MLPADFLTRPIAHRALHDKAAGRVENSPSAIQAAIDKGYGIEIDLQLSKDGVPMVFHDYALNRLTSETGAVAQRTADELSQITLTGGTDTIPTLAGVLVQVSGRVPLLIEIKDQDGALGPKVGPLEDATAALLKGYKGPVAVMSFNPHSVAHMATVLPDIPRGLTTCNYVSEDWPTIPKATRERLALIPDYETAGACFISHQHDELDAKRVAELAEMGAKILCWTIRSTEQEKNARQIADNITFEGYLA